MIDCTVVIATYNRRDVLDATLSKLGELPERPPVVVVEPGAIARAIGSFGAGASVMCREAFLSAGGYHGRYHIGAEESFLALDLLDAGWEMIYAGDVVVHRDPCTIGRLPDGRLRTRGLPWVVRERRPVDRRLEAVLDSVTELSA